MYFFFAYLWFLRFVCLRDNFCLFKGLQGLEGDEVKHAQPPGPKFGWIKGVLVLLIIFMVSKKVFFYFIYFVDAMHPEYFGHDAISANQLDGRRGRYRMGYHDRTIKLRRYDINNVVHVRYLYERRSERR